MAASPAFSGRSFVFRSRQAAVLQQAEVLYPALGRRQIRADDERRLYSVGGYPTSILYPEKWKIAIDRLTKNGKIFPTIVKIYLTSESTSTSPN